MLKFCQFIGMVVLSVAVLHIQAGESCPAQLMGLLPAGAVHGAGQYNAAGTIGIGFVAADLPFAHPCLTSSKYPGRISIDIQHYWGDGLQIFVMQVDAVGQQTIQNAKDNLMRMQNGLTSKGKHVEGMRPVTTQTVPGGAIVYFDFDIDCSLGVKRTHPSTHLIGFAHTASSLMNIKIDGFMSAAAAKNAALEAVAKFNQADFSALEKSK